MVTRASILSLTAFITFSIFTLQAQTTVLSKKETENRLEEIQSQIDGKEFEMAMELLKSKTEVLLEENVPKKAQELYDQIKATLKEKEALFQKHVGLDLMRLNVFIHLV